jgi:hypothetical protein
MGGDLSAKTASPATVSFNPSSRSGYHMHTSQDVYLWRTKIVSLINGSHWSSCDYHLSARGIPKYLIEESFLGCVHNV